MKNYNNLCSCIQLDFIAKHNVLKTKYFKDLFYLERFVRSNDIFVISIYDYELHDFLYNVDKKDLFLFRIKNYLNKE